MYTTLPLFSTFVKLVDLACERLIQLQLYIFFFFLSKLVISLDR